MPLRRLLGSSWVPMLVTAIGIVALLHRTGVGFGGLGRYALYLAFAIAVPGVLAWRMLLANLHTGRDEPPTWFEDLSLGTIFGFGIQLPFYLVGVLIGIPFLFLATPVLLLTIAVTTPFGRRAWTLPTRRLDVRAAWALTLVVGYGLVWLARDVFVLRPLSLAANQTPGVDETFHHALASELLHHFPPQIPFLLGTPLDYHWFAHAQLATTMWATELRFEVLVRQLFPAALLVLTVLGLGAVALRLTGRHVAAVIAPALLVAGGFYLMGPDYNPWPFSESYMSQQLVASPSQTYGFAMALPAIYLSLEVLRPDRRASRLTWLTLALALLALSGAKATFMPLFLCGALALWLLRLLVRRTFDRTAAAITALFLAVTAFAQFVLFSGNSGALGLEPLMTVAEALARQGIPDTAGARVAMTTTLLIGWLLFGAGIFGLSRRGRWRDPRAIWLLCAIPPGILVALLLFRSGLSQLWFQRSTVELVILLSTWGIAGLLPRPLPARVGLRLAAVAAGAGFAAFLVSWSLSIGQPEPSRASLPELLATVSVAALALAVVLVLSSLAKRARVSAGALVAVLAFVVGLGSAHVYEFGYEAIINPVSDREPHDLFAPGGVTAARWLATHSAPNAVVATNVHCMEPKQHPCDNRNFWVSAFAERRIVVEGWGYTAATNASSVPDATNKILPIPDPKRLAINDAAFDRPSRATISRLVQAYGVSWLFVSKKYPVDLGRLNALTGVVQRSFRNSNYVVFRVLRGGAR